MGTLRVDNITNAEGTAGPNLADPTFAGTVTLQQTTEVLNVILSATGTVDHNFANGAVWYHSNILDNFTANFTNIPTTDNRTINIALILEQTGTPYIPNEVEIDGVAQTVKYASDSFPTGTANAVDVISYTTIRQDETFTVLGALKGRLSINLVSIPATVFIDSGSSPAMSARSSRNFRQVVPNSVSKNQSTLVLFLHTVSNVL